MPPISEQERGYRRGLVLGLTMAEIAVLVIFVLLLVLGTLLARQARDVEALRERNATLETTAAEVDRIASAIGLHPEVIKQELVRAKETRRRLVLLQKEAARLSELEQALESVRPDGTPKQPLPELFRELLMLRDAIVKAGTAATPDALKQTLAEAAKAKEALIAVAGKDAAAVAEENARLARENANLKSQMANLRRQAQSGGRGLDHPPCWAKPDGKPEYIFDVALTSQGLILRDQHLPYREAERAILPLAGYMFGEELPPEKFLSMTEPLFRWSVDKKCRFYVRAFDNTGVTEKTIYKHHMRVLEWRFYKHEVLRERF